MLDHTTRRERLQIDKQFKRRFFSKTEKTKAGCVVWTGQSHNVRLPDGSYTTPRRAAYLIKHGVMPARELKLKCATETCVNWRHFTEGRASKSGKRRELDEAERAQIIKLHDKGKGRSKRSLAKEFKVSIGTIFNVVGRQ